MEYTKEIYTFMSNRSIQNNFNGNETDIHFCLTFKKKLSACKQVAIERLKRILWVILALNSNKNY